MKPITSIAGHVLNQKVYYFIASRTEGSYCICVPKAKTSYYSISIQLVKHIFTVKHDYMVFLQL